MVATSDCFAIAETVSFMVVVCINQILSFAFKVLNGSSASD